MTQPDNRKKRYILMLTVVVLALFGVMFYRSLPLMAKGEEQTEAEQDGDQTETTTESVAQIRSSLADLKDSKKSAEVILNGFEDLKTNVIQYMGELDQKVAQLEDDLINMVKQQEGIEDNLKKVQLALEQDRLTEQKQYSSMKLRIRYMYEHGNGTFLDAMAGSTSFGDMLNRSTLASQIQKYDNKLLKQYRSSLQSISEKEQVISTKQEELATITQSLQTERDVVTTLLESKSKELEVYNHNIKAASKLIKYYEDEEDKKEAQIRAAEESYDDDEIFDDLPSTYSGGKFLWPAPGHYQITSKFGYRVHPLTGTRRLHAGIDIAVPSGCGIYAAADGVVAVSTYSSSAGNYVMINHGGGISTVYMHNSKLLVSVGDQVKRGQKIALSGSTGWSTGPHCHFGVRKNGTYVNPIPYLKSTSSSDEADYKESDTPDTDSDSLTNTTTNQKDDEANIKREDSDTSAYTTEADDAGDKGKKSSDLKDDSDPDSE